MFKRLRMMLRVYRSKSPRVVEVEKDHTRIKIRGGDVWLYEHRTDNRGCEVTIVMVRPDDCETHQLVRSSKDFALVDGVGRMDIVKLKAPRRQKKEEASHETKNSGTAD